MEAKQLLDEASISFHCTITQILIVAGEEKWDIQTTVAFLTT